MASSRISHTFIFYRKKSPLSIPISVPHTWSGDFNRRSNKGFFSYMQRMSHRKALQLIDYRLLYTLPVLCIQTNGDTTVQIRSSVNRVWFMAWVCVNQRIEVTFLSELCITNFILISTRPISDVSTCNTEVKMAIGKNNMGRVNTRFLQVFIICLVAHCTLINCKKRKHAPVVAFFQGKKTFCLLFIYM